MVDNEENIMATLVVFNEYYAFTIFPIILILVIILLIKVRCNLDKVAIAQVITYTLITFIQCISYKVDST